MIFFLLITIHKLINWHKHSMSFSLTEQYLGVSAIVQRGNFTWGGNSHKVHSKQGVIPGKITLEFPLKPSVPPSIMGFIVVGSTFPSSSYSIQKVTKERQKAKAQEKSGKFTSFFCASAQFTHQSRYLHERR